MRPGLVAVGTAFAALAAAGIVALYLIPTPTASTVNSVTTVWTVGPFATNSSELRGTPARSGSVDIQWQSSLPITVRIYTSTGCEPGFLGCPDWQLAVNLTDQPSGTFTPHGGALFPYLFVWSNPINVAGSVSVTTTVSTSAPETLAPWSQIVLALGVVALGFVGAVALFLGFFLRPGVYRRPAPLVSRQADDAEAIADSTRPPPVH